MRALVLNSADKGKSVTATVKTLALSDLRQADGDVLVRVGYSGLNYKDALAITNAGKIIRSFPFIPGIDFAGTVEEGSGNWKKGDQVVVTGYGVGERTWGGLSEYARVKAHYLVKTPPSLSQRDCMAIGTAGFTAMQCVLALEEHGVLPGSGPVLVTGSTGGVGSVAVAVLAKLGYKVTALTGKPDSESYLKSIGASATLDRATLSGPAKALDGEKWAGVIDTIGGNVLAAAISQTKYGGAVAACGMAGGNEFKSSVFPFILRGVNLLGIDSVMCPQARRQVVWDRLARDLPKDAILKMVKEVGLEDVPDVCKNMIAATTSGRTVVKIASAKL
ncbi:alcohol dehydrogenase superfamily, zinc-containing protein [Gonapodya prolifera JEL478]|uniref:Alcohol dehydrogenase superfamily, zinc-containing protein n=1 Tax=Gonapodya prolifera (strain JEL478) TaxID=1344416 RepID=A0A139AMW4_GONPJ|nr:alcohol dehydrogenase superfamily, zinc-containing protein [Gonapodya prolifera JEL478]|eukprot:KXS18111.1 alcohol dehydrogenase superfamily, zinc-containing protein [Gonapodya prolifera JEL478]